MGYFIVGQVSKLMAKKNIQLVNANILIMGLAFKENCPDIRNTKVIDLINEFKDLNCNVDVYDPWVKSEDAINEYKIQLIDEPHHKKYDAIVLAVAHDKIKEISLEELKTYGKDSHVIYDVKYLFKSDDVDGRL